MSIRDNLDIIDRVATAIESKMYRIHEPAPETAEAREVRLKAETAANRRVANEVRPTATPSRRCRAVAPEAADGPSFPRWPVPT